MELKLVLKSLSKLTKLKYFLISFFFLSIGVQTIILMAGIFGSEELGLPTFNLILTIVIIQLVAIFGAFFFSRLSTKIGNISTLKITLLIWGTVCFIAFILDKNLPDIDVYFYVLAIILGLVLGATQTLTRSTYSKLLKLMIMRFILVFSDVTEKLAIVFGMFIFGFLLSITGSAKFCTCIVYFLFISIYIPI